MINQFKENTPLSDYKYSTVDLDYAADNHQLVSAVLRKKKRLYENRYSEHILEMTEDPIHNLRKFQSDLNAVDRENDTIMSYIADPALHKLVIVQNHKPTDFKMSWKIVGLDKNNCPLETALPNGQKRDYKTDDLIQALTTLNDVEEARLSAKGVLPADANPSLLPGYEPEKHFAKMLFSLKHRDLIAPNSLDSIRLI